MDNPISLPQLNARLFLLERELAKACEQKKKLEDRCTQVLGRFLLAQIRKRYGRDISLADTQHLTLDGTRLDEWLTDAGERQAFGLSLFDDRAGTADKTAASAAMPYYGEGHYAGSSLTISFQRVICSVQTGLSNRDRTGVK